MRMKTLLILLCVFVLLAGMVLAVLMIYPPEEINGKKHGCKIHNGLHPHTAI